MMTDIQRSVPDSAYSYRSVRFYCTNCQRQFSELSLSNTSSPQARCPRCNRYADPAPQPQSNTQSNRTNTQSNRTSTNSNTNSTTRPNRPNRQQQAPNNQYNSNPFGFYGQQMNSPFGTGFFQGFGAPVNNRGQNNQTRNGNMFSQVFGDFFGVPAGGQNFGFVDEAGWVYPSDVFSGNNSMYNDFGPAMPDDMVIEEFLRDDPNEHGPPPAPETAIKRLKEIYFDPACKDEGSDNHCCPVCQEDFKERERLVRLPCKHDYHGGCVKPWLEKHNSCPMCRVPIDI